MAVRLDKASFLGLLLGGMAVIGGQYLEGGSLRMIFQGTAFIIVFGGTLGAVCLSFPFTHLKAAFRELWHIFGETEDNALSLIGQLTEFAYRTRREGILSLERDIDHIQDPFFRRALQLAVDGLEPKMLRDIMRMELQQLHSTGLIPARVFESAGGYAPTIGILGAVLGLIQVMNYLTEPSKLGSGVATAFVATIYGVGSANLFFLPIGHKLRLRLQRRLILKEITLEGILAVCSGEHPRLIEENLKGFLADMYAPPPWPVDQPSPRLPSKLAKPVPQPIEIKHDAAPL